MRLEYTCYNSEPSTQALVATIAHEPLMRVRLKSGSFGENEAWEYIERG